LILIYVHDETICGVSATLRDPKRYKRPIRIAHSINHHGESRSSFAKSGRLVDRSIGREFFGSKTQLLPPT